MTTFRWYILGLLALFGGYVALEYYRPKPLDWSPTLSRKDKIPYGTYVLYDALPQVLATDSVETLRQPIYNQLLGEEEPSHLAGRYADYASDSVVRDTAAARRRYLAARREEDEELAAAQAQSDSLNLVETRANYLFINQEFSASKLETKALLRFVATGHDVFIAAEDFGYGGRGSLPDTLGFDTREADEWRLSQAAADSAVRHLATHQVDSVELHLLAARPGLPARGFRFSLAATKQRLVLTKKRAHQGATLAADAQGRPVLVRLDHGRGHFYLCSVPLALGNYWVLRPRTADFAFAALSYLPAGRPAWWDEYQKQGREGERSLLRVVTAQPALRTAYYLLLAGGLLFVFIEARRRQRIIPTLKPLPNTTLLFTRTVAGLYQQGRNHAQIAEKKVTLFLDYLRQRFQETTADFSDPEFRERLGQKAGLPPERIEELAQRLNFARTSPVVSDQQLLVLSRTIRDFKQAVR